MRAARARRGPTPTWPRAEYAARRLLSIGWAPSRDVAGRGDRVALTFDDGPDPNFTPDLVRVLGEAQAPSTFFLVGRNVHDHPDTVRMIVAEGHAVGSHSYSHPEPWTRSLRSLTEDYSRGRQALEEVVGTEVPLFRPPKGYIDARGVAAMRANRLVPWLWTVDSEDWRPDCTRVEIMARVKRVRPGDVLLFHDAIEGPLQPSARDRSHTVTVIPDVVAALRAEGLEFTTLAADDM